MEFVVGPVIALLLSLKFTEMNAKKRSDEEAQQWMEINEKVELLQSQYDKHDTEMLQKVMTTVMPIAKAVNKLNQEVGLR